MGLFSFLTDDSRTQDSLTPQAVTRLETLAHEEAAVLLTSIPIYLRQATQTIEALLFDPYRGIYIFECCDWRYETLKGVTAERPRADDKRVRDITLESAYTFISRKFNEILHTDPCEINSFLIFEHLNSEEFERLDASFHALLPRDRLIFADESIEQSTSKLHAVTNRRDTPLSDSLILGALFFHLQIPADNLHDDRPLLSKEQSDFMQSDLPPLASLSGPYGSGKSTLVLLKAILYLLQKKAKTVLIIAATQAACDLLKKELLEIVEYAIIDIELTSIRILTPEQLIAQHYQRLYKKESFSFAKITPKMLSHHYFAAEIIFCDDSHLLEPEFIAYLRHLQRKHALCLVRREPSGAAGDYSLTHSFRTPPSLLKLCDDPQNTSITEGVQKVQGNPYMYTLLKLQKLLEHYGYSDLLIIVPHAQFALKLLDEINSYYGTISSLYQAHEGLLVQELDRILIATVSEIAHLQRPVVVLVCEGTYDQERFCHALTRASKEIYLIQNRDTHEEDSQNSSRVAGNPTA
ncbi:MAG: hypothetical protein JXK05_06625 [Campylobacterales bacterium]|nr:hypothetical protein [Campylobacterales bacterium]